MSTRRQARLNSFLVREISGIIREIKIDRIGFVTVTRADIAPDLRDARIFVSVFGDAGEAQRNLDILARASGFIRSRLGKFLATRIIPRLIFVLDSEVATLDEMSRLIDEARAGDPHPAAVDETADADASAADAEKIGDFPPLPRDLA
ncbi:ribosome-binding factor A [Planctomycetales bacterium]|nr:ribosome-binding factor A [Planctomycetales bacterium]GHS98094.1 ribosome-binding factor A [Planctomycetales bacterium]GHT05390.1 ribosome-binding factor A [Planctomycetales bacterium]GHV22704.1 ribosome-binding factor A [Planctomycetales bacterium]